GVVTGILCWIFAPRLLGVMGASPEVIALGGGYARVVTSANVVILLLFIHNAIFRGAGDAALAMRALWLGNGINLVLDPCLIFGWGPFPAMGLEGAAVATVIGRSVAVGYQMYHLRRGRSRVKLRGAVLRPDFGIMQRLIRVSIGGISQMLIATSSWVAMMRLMSTFGSASIAGYTIAIRIVIFTILPSWGLSNAAATLVGQHLGAKLPDRAARAVWLTGLYNMAFLALVTLGFLLFGEVFVGIFTKDPEVLEIGVRCLHVFAYGYLFYGWGMIMTQAFNGAGDTMTPTWMNLIAFWIFQIPFAWWLAFHLKMGPSGVFWAIISADTMMTLMAMVMFFRGTWKKRVV
ncbi:MAG: MATE family efflux transporter, partial [Verrucomicrobiales bacterium]